MLFKKKFPEIERPEEIQIETTNRCNARCVFCHHPNMKRPKTDISDELFQKLVRDAKELQVKAIHPFVNGEPFLDRHIFERLSFINTEFPEANICLFTNGGLLDSEKLAKLSQIKNIDVINFSLNAFEPQDYKSRVGLNFEKTVANIKAVLELNRLKPFVRKIVIASVEYGKEDRRKNKEYNDQFRQFCEREFPGAEIKIGYKYNYISRIFSFRSFQDLHCPRLKTMTVLANGLVSLCCMDMEGEYILGNANERSLLDIYNGALAQEYRRNRKSKMLPCRYCNMI